MSLIFLVLSVSALALGTSGEDDVRNSSRIVGGEENNIPYAVQIFHIPDIYLCTGSLIEKNVVATAASCVAGFEATRLRVRIKSAHGFPGGLVPIVQKITHRFYSYGKPDFDVAELIVDRYSSYENIDYAEPSKDEPEPGDIVTVSGWGSKTEGGPFETKMQTAKMKIVDREVCQKAYGKKFKITTRMLCASMDGAGPCTGDIGGPIVSEHAFVGLVSFGLTCGKSELPSVFTNVASPDIHSFLKGGGLGFKK